MQEQITFNPEQIAIVNESTALAEELVSNYYKMSAGQWLHPMYDVKTLVDLEPSEIVDGPFAQIIRYEGKKNDTELGSSAYDFYKICIQDHSILSILKEVPDISLMPFALYIIAHELVHIVRFGKFLQNFTASPEETMAEEKRVHEATHTILKAVQSPDMGVVFGFYAKWRRPLEDLHNPRQKSTLDKKTSPNP